MKVDIHPWLIHVNGWQKPLQYCKVIRLQLIKINEKKKKMDTLQFVFICLSMCDPKLNLYIPSVVWQVVESEIMSTLTNSLSLVMKLQPTFTYFWQSHLLHHSSDSHESSLFKPYVISIHGRTNTWLPISRLCSWFLKLSSEPHSATIYLISFSSLFQPIGIFFVLILSSYLLAILLALQHP